MPNRPFERYPKPLYIAIEPTDQCNLRCTMCERLGNLKPLNINGGFLSMELFEQVADYLEPEMAVCLGGFGEAMMHPHYAQMLKRIKTIGCRTITYSNGLLLNREIAETMVQYGMDELSISIDGATSETYREIRRADLNVLHEKITLLAETRRQASGTTRPKIVIQMVGMRDNLHELAELVRFADSAGADAVTVINLSCHMPELKEQSLFMHPELWKTHFPQALAEGEKRGIEVTLPEMEPATFACRNFFASMFITWDGLVQPCGLERYILGDIVADSIEQVWNGPAYEQYRRRYEEEGAEAVCVNCHRLTNDKEAWINPPQPPYPVRLTYRQQATSPAK